jgi:hypothetical protein
MFVCSFVGRAAIDSIRTLGWKEWQRRGKEKEKEKDTKATGEGSSGGTRLKSHQIFFLCVVLGVELRAYTLSHSTSPFLWWVFFYRVSWTICMGWLWTMILLISASRVARITCMSHRCPGQRVIFFILRWAPCTCRSSEAPRCIPSHWRQRSFHAESHSAHQLSPIWGGGSAQNGNRQELNLQESATYPGGDSVSLIPPSAGRRFSSYMGGRDLTSYKPWGVLFAVGRLWAGLEMVQCSLQNHPSECLRVGHP